MTDNSPTTRTRSSYLASAGFFFLLVILLSIPFYVLGAAGDRLPIMTFLPISALATFVPMIAALILVCRERGAQGVRELLARVLDYRRIKSAGWGLTAVLLMPMVFLLAYGVLRLEGRALPDAQYFSIAEMIAFTLLFFAGAVGEELGWQGYGFAKLNRRWTALEAALIIGVIWALWHVIPFVEMGRSAYWIIWHSLSIVMLRIIIVWLFVNTGQSVFIAALFHTTTNLAWGLIANYGSFYDPLVMLIILILLAVTIVMLWGPSTLAHFKTAQDRA